MNKRLNTNTATVPARTGGAADSIAVNTRAKTMPQIKILTFNCEGYSNTKANLITSTCQDENINVVLLQETHKSSKTCRPTLDGFKLANEIPHAKHGSAVFVRNDIILERSETQLFNSDIETITLHFNNISITSVYKPPKTTLPLIST